MQDRCGPRFTPCFAMNRLYFNPAGDDFSSPELYDIYNLGKANLYSNYKILGNIPQIRGKLHLPDVFPQCGAPFYWASPNPYPRGTGCPASAAAKRSNQRKKQIRLSLFISLRKPHDCRGRRGRRPLHVHFSLDSNGITWLCERDNHKNKHSGAEPEGPAPLCSAVI